MKLFLPRSEKGTPTGTYGRVVDEFGRLWVPVTLEPIEPVDAGEYVYDIVESDEFRMPVPRATNVPGHSGVEFHRGNSIRDTKNCQLCGMVRGMVDYDDGTPLIPGILQSKTAFDAFMAALAAAGVTSFTLTITDP